MMENEKTHIVVTIGAEHILKTDTIPDNIRIVIRHEDGSEAMVTTHNAIMDAGRNLMRDALRGAVSSPAVTYVAFGTSSTAVATGQTQLGTEVYRQQVTSTSAGATGASTITVVIDANTLNGTSIQEIGWFAGPGAGPGINTGVMVARVLYSHNKLSSESVQIDRIDQF